MDLANGKRHTCDIGATDSLCLNFVTHKQGHSTRDTRVTLSLTIVHEEFKV